MNGELPEPVVFVVDDDRSVQRSLGRLLRTAGYAVESATSAEEFLHRVSLYSPSCIVLDIGLPGLNGIDLQRVLNERHSWTPIVFITGVVDVPMLVKVMKAGAEDVLAKPFRPGDFLDAIRRAVDAHARLQESENRCDQIRLNAQALSPRERQVMGLVVQGLLNKQSGRMLGVTEKTIKVHRGQVMRKMQARSLAELIRMAECLN